MYDPSLVGVFERFGNLPGDGQRFLDRNRPLGDAIRERRPFRQLHHQGTRVARIFKTVDRSNVGMIQRGEKSGFASEARHAGTVARERFRQNLNRYITIQLRIASPIDLAHAALAEQDGDLIRAESCADYQSHDFASDYRTFKVSGRKTAISETRELAESN